MKILKEKLNPLNDFLFMKYMGEKGDEEQLTAFLNVVLKKTDKGKITSVTILEDRNLPADIIGDKSSVLDVRAEMSNGTKVNIEVQLRNVGNMDKRSLFYWSREYSKSIEAGDDYDKLSNVITINIVGTKYLAINAVHTSFHLWEDTNKDYMLTDVLEIHFIDMVEFGKLKEIDIEHNALYRWLAFFDKKTSNETLKKIIDMDTAIKKAYEKMTSVMQSKEALRIYQMREKAVYDYNSGMSFAKREGLKEGEEKGLKKGLKKGKLEGLKEGEERGLKKGIALIAINLKQEGFSIEQIAHFTGKTTEEVIKIFKEHGLT
jgi:predicted transposase/invertase (TIGR01784 family)